MTTRMESSLKKLEKEMMKNLRRWANNLGVLHKGKDLDELEDGFSERGYDLFIVREGSTIKMYLTDKKTKKDFYKGEVELDIDLRSDTALYSGS
jgi:hypothetical protein